MGTTRPFIGLYDYYSARVCCLSWPPGPDSRTYSQSMVTRSMACKPRAVANLGNIDVIDLIDFKSNDCGPTGHAQIC
jgi:hypothetical protein